MDCITKQKHIIHRLTNFLTVLYTTLFFHINTVLPLLSSGETYNQKNNLKSLLLSVKSKSWLTSLHIIIFTSLGNFVEIERFPAPTEETPSRPPDSLRF